jgi:AcrR family transcriptional regulator
MTTSLRERRKQILRDEILDAARTLLSEKGYTAMSMDELAAQVGISKPTLYSHYPTKDDIVVATVVREMERFLEVIEAHDPDQTPLQRLTRVMERFIKFHAEKEGIEPRSWTPEIFQLLCSREDALNCIRRIDSAIVALAQAGIGAGEINPALDAGTVASAFFALASALRHVRFARGGTGHPQSAEMLTTIFLRGVRPS